jgi:hypothetical protein
MAPSQKVPDAEAIADEKLQYSHEAMSNDADEL